MFDAHSIDGRGSALAVSLEGVVKRYAEAVILDHFDLSVPRGEKLAIIGPSGSGKSTVLRLIKGLEPFEQGRILVAGEPIGSANSKRPILWTSRAEPKPHRVGMIFQQFNLFPHMSVLANITEAPRRVLRLSRREAESQARDLLAMVGLDDKEESYPRQLSGGQQQRVAIARALAMRPETMLFDEVTSALDPELVGEVLKVIRRLSREDGMTMILVTHEMKFAREVSDRVVFMEKGRVIEEGPPSTIFGSPRNERTRQFLSAVFDR